MHGKGFKLQQGKFNVERPLFPLSSLLYLQASNGCLVWQHANTRGRLDFSRKLGERERERERERDLQGKPERLKALCVCERAKTKFVIRSQQWHKKMSGHSAFMADDKTASAASKKGSSSL